MHRIPFTTIDPSACHNFLSFRLPQRTMSQTNANDQNGKEMATPIAATNLVLCSCCKEQKTNTNIHFYKKQRQAIRKFGSGICRECWDKKPHEENLNADEKERKRKPQEQEGKPKTKKQKKAERRREQKVQQKKRRELDKQQGKNRDELNQLLAAKPRKCCNCHKVKSQKQFSETQYKVGTPAGRPFVKDEKYGRIPKGLIEYVQQESILVGKCLECYPRDEELRRQKIKALHDNLQEQRKAYDEQLEKGEIFYQYPEYLWGTTTERHFESRSPKSLVGVYDIIYVTSSGPDRSENKTVKNATLTISHNGQNICGKVEGQLYDGDFKFEGNDNRDFTVVEHGWAGLSLFEDEENRIPTCTVNVFAHRFVCRWVDTPFGYSVKRNEGLVPMCDTLEEANVFIAQQQSTIDHSKSWISNHLGLPTTAVSLIHKYAKAWTPPDPFFFFEKGDLRLRVLWFESGGHESDSASEYIARKRPS